MSKRRPRSTERANGPLPCSRRAGEGVEVPLVDQTVELAGVLAGHLAGDFGGQVAELLVDVLLRFRPYPIGMRVVGAPHQGLDPHLLDQLGADAVELERCLALAAP